MTPIAEWLRSTRERQHRADGEPWSQDDFLAELERASGWHLHRPNYSNYERGKATPKRETLAKLVAFWAARGEPGPDLTPPPAPAEPLDLATALLGLTRELGAWRLERQSMRAEIEELQAMVAAHDLRLRSAPSAGGNGSQAAPGAPQESAG